MSDHTPTIEENWEERFDKELVTSMPDGTKIVAFYDKIEGIDFWQDYKVKNFIKEVESSAYTRGQQDIIEKIKERMKNETDEGLWTLESLLEFLTNTKHED